MTKTTFPLFLLVLIIGLAGGYALRSQTPPPPAPDLDLSKLADPSKRLVAVAEKIRPAVVHIKASGRSSASGSGVIVSADGRVLTNHQIGRASCRERV